ncbi:MAG TPA: phytanoyl-CoA dioxygenase family protein [Acidimicrobiales bacterium]|nr:phytanoyl-CoA dioxygenase family protein [Acidimicrobiales bacterium]
MVKQLLGDHSWFAELFTAAEANDPVERIRRFMLDDAEIDGIRVRVRELTGSAGDVVLLHPWLLHCASANTADRPRMMVTHTIYR